MLEDFRAILSAFSEEHGGDRSLLELLHNLVDPSVGVLESALLAPGMRGLHAFLEDDLEPVVVGSVGRPRRMCITSPIVAAAIEVRKPHMSTRINCILQATYECSFRHNLVVIFHLSLLVSTGESLFCG